ncbi:TRAP transporter small permease [Amorphus sp. 3PC139-8]|uniref:TRAP transporter small permease n=1 Tax=Amorphus sp. 3PC139-8 TaxID=2735676 RepID=UPI00345C833D
MRPLSLFFRAHDVLTDTTYIIGVFGLASMVIIYCAEVVTRYFLNSALDWANDAFSNILCITIFAMVPHVTRIGSHIEINLIPELLPSVRRPLATMGSIVGAFVCGFAAWMSLQENVRQVALGIQTAQNHPLPVIWMSGFITYGFASSALYFLRSLFPYPAVLPVSFVTQMAAPSPSSGIE